MITKTLDGILYKNFEDAAEHSLEMLCEFIDADQIVIVALNGESVKVIKSFANKRRLIPEEAFLSFSPKYHRAMKDNNFKPLFITDTQKDPLTEDLSITQKYGVRSFVDVPFNSGSGMNKGTIMALNRTPYNFTSKHSEIIRLVSTNLSYVLTLEEQLIKDSLTGAYSRKYLENYFNELNEIEKTTISKEVSVFFVDFDGFKFVNDNYGHEVGDFLLQELSRRIENSLNFPPDFISRLGGDEFLVVYHHTNLEKLRELGGDLLNTISKPIVYGNEGLSITASIGVATYHKDSIHLKDLIRIADRRMYKAKKSGKNNIVYNT